jgi:hypothetical protein
VAADLLVAAAAVVADQVAVHRPEAALEALAVGHRAAEAAAAVPVAAWAVRLSRLN